MMQWVGNLSLRAKLRVIVVYAAAAAVFIAGLLYASGEVLTLRRSQAQQLLTLVTAVGDNAASPLKTFNRTLARKALASLHDDPDIRAAALYDAAGNLFADLSFGKESGSPSDRLREWAIDAAGRDAEAIRFNGLTEVQIQAAVMVDGERLGTIIVNAQLTQLYGLLPGSPEHMLMGFLAALLVAYALSIRLQRFIAAPIHDLAAVARNVCASKKFSIRAHKQVDDDFGALIDDFNEMLAELERRDLTRVAGVKLRAPGADFLFQHLGQGGYATVERLAQRQFGTGDFGALQEISPNGLPRVFQFSARFTF